MQSLCRCLRPGRPRPRPQEGNGAPFAPAANDRQDDAVQTRRNGDAQAAPAAAAAAAAAAVQGTAGRADVGRAPQRPASSSTAARPDAAVRREQVVVRFASETENQNPQPGVIIDQRLRDELREAEREQAEKIEKERALDAERKKQQQAKREATWKRWRKQKGHEPLGGRGGSALDRSFEFLTDLKTLYPDCAIGLLEVASQYVTFDEALDVVVDCLAKGLTKPAASAPARTPELQLPISFGMGRERIVEAEETTTCSTVSNVVAVDGLMRNPKSMHDFVAVTVSAPSWCQECKGFLWGIKDQGVSCQRCHVMLCTTCSQSTSSTCVTDKLNF